MFFALGRWSKEDKHKFEVKRQSKAMIDMQTDGLDILNAEIVVCGTGVRYHTDRGCHYLEHASIRLAKGYLLCTRCAAHDGG